MKKARSLTLFLLLVLVSSFCIANLYSRHLRSSTLILPVLSQFPSRLVKMVSLEFHGLVADYMMLHVLTFMGEKILYEEPTTPEEWQSIYKALKTIIDLDPRATDPFILATTTLPWEAGMINETNELLEKVAEFRPDDYRPNFFIWYNYYHFLNDMDKAAIYLKKAAAIPGSPGYLKPLAARMHLYSGQIEGSILYTKEVIESTDTQDAMRKYLVTRLEVLQIIYSLEEKVNDFKMKFGSFPGNLEDLVHKRSIEKIPEDPYGGKFYLMPNGKVYTTSKLVPIKSDTSKPATKITK